MLAAAGVTLAVLIGGVVAAVTLTGSDKNANPTAAAAQNPNGPQSGDETSTSAGPVGGRDETSPLPSTAVAPAQLKPGFELTAGQGLRSGNGKYTLTQQPDGNLVLADDAKRVQWTSQTTGNPGATTSFDRTGDLVVYNKSGIALWRNTTNGQAALLELRDDGNAVLTRADKTELWSSKTERSRLYSGQMLTSGQQRRTADGKYTLAQNADGNLVITGADKKVVWNAQTSGHQGAYTLMQDDGNLVVYSTDKKPQWSSGTSGTTGASAVLNADGNLTVTAAGKTLWATATDGFTKLTAGQRMESGQSRTAPKGGFTLLMQPDGNLVLQNAAKSIVWKSGTNGHPGSSLRFQADGNLVIYDAAGTAIWSTKTTGKAATQLLVQDDGTIALYTAAKVAVWSSKTG
ncbi:hypothetical protein [Dactylosporangium sp. CS-033363]|uniref:hypothetical protein n=1 Tax=Dactylosporangium sp. CS-033363 TaxID=3239935 RepID=UPI003D8AEFD5